MKTIVAWGIFVQKDHKVILDVCTVINHLNDNKYRLCYRFGSLSVVVPNTGTSSNTITDVTDIRSLTGALKVKPWLLLQLQVFETYFPHFTCPKNLV